jgi:hypothetical protein
VRLAFTRKPFRRRIRTCALTLRKIEAERKAKADAEVTARRASHPQVVADAEALIAAWNERQDRRMPLLFAPMIGAAVGVREFAPGGPMEFLAPPAVNHTSFVGITVGIPSFSH